MRVLIHTEDASGRDGLYTKPSIDEALDCFYSDGEVFYTCIDGDEDEDNILSREDAKLDFENQGEVTFYDEDGCKTHMVREVT